MNTRVIYLAGGCFWGIQAYFSRIEGVLETIAGYANSAIPNPSYELVCSGRSGAVEAVEVRYDEARITLHDIVTRLLAIIDPSAKDYQGNDIGTQYRNGVYYVTDSSNEEHLEHEVILACIATWEKKHKKTAATEVMPLQNFTHAEAYHQHYLKHNPQGYCHIPLA